MKLKLPPPTHTPPPPCIIKICWPDLNDRREQLTVNIYCINLYAIFTGRGKKLSLTKPLIKELYNKLVFLSEYFA